MEPVDYIVLIMTIAICAVVTGVLVYNYVHGTVLDEEKAKIIRDILLTMLAIVSLYVGSKLNRK